MPDPTPDIVVSATDWSDVGYQIFNGFLKRFVESKAGEMLPATLAEGALAAKHAGLHAIVYLATMIGKGLVEIEEPLQPIIAGLVVPVVEGLFGAEISAGSLSKTLTSDQAQAAGRAIVRSFLGSITGDAAAEVAPSTEGSERMAAAAVSATLHSVINAVLPEVLSDMLGEFGPRITALTEVPEEVLRTLGVGRLVRRALTPYVTATCSRPAEWALNKQHRPTLLGAGTLAKLIARDPASADKWREDLRREGYSEDRIDALLREQRHFFSPGDVRTFQYRGHWTHDRALQHLRDQGYDEDAATDALRLEGLRRIEQLEGTEGNAILAAYVRGDIDHGTMAGLLATAISVETERTLLLEEADVRRAAGAQQLSLGQVEAMVKSGVLTFIDYRRTAERLNYAPEAVTALELQLRYEVDKQKSIEDHRRELEESRAAEQAARAAERQRRLDEVAAQRALARRGSESQLEAAAVRGLIPLARVEEVYAAKYDGDTVDLLLDDLAARRQAFVDREQAAEDAKRRAAVRNVDVGALQQAVYEGVLTVDEFRRRLDGLNFTPADAELLAATTDARLQALRAAQQQREDAAAAAKRKSIDLGRFELLVRRGHRTLRDYEALLASLGYDEGSRAAMGELLQLHIDDDAAAAKLRAARETAAGARELSLDQIRRAVILKLLPIDRFTPWLLQHGYSSDDAALLLGELQADVEEADAARARRQAADRRSQAPRVPLADVRRAARLGLLGVPVYVARLQAEGYDDDDIAIELDLLAAEIASDRARHGAADALDAAAPGRGLSLSQLAAAVLAGVRPIEDYYARAIAIGLGTEDAAALTATLQATLDATAAARARKQQLAAEGADRELARADVEKAVRQGLKTFDDYAAWLRTAGYAEDDAALLVAELQIALDGKIATDAGGGTV